MPILQIDKQSVNAANPKPLEVKVLMENLTQDEHSVRFAECTAKLESSLGQESSKSRHVRCARQHCSPLSLRAGNGLEEVRTYFFDWK